MDSLRTVQDVLPDHEEETESSSDEEDQNITSE